MLDLWRAGVETSSRRRGGLSEPLSVKKDASLDF